MSLNQTPMRLTVSRRPMFPAFAGPGNEAARLAFLTAVLALALMAATSLAALVETREINGVNLWIKPLHFQFSLAAHFTTLALLLRLVAPPLREGRLMRWTMRAAVFAFASELTWLMVEAARGRASHFNADTRLEQILYPLMGLGAIMLIVAALVTGLLIRKSPTAGQPTGLRSGAINGLILGFVATLLVAGLMSSGQVDGPGHWVGGVHTDAGGLPIVGWSTTGGDLRVPHFFATHMMQALPLAGLLADRLWPARARGLVIAMTGGSLLLIAATLAQALAGRPFLAGF